MHFNPLLLIYAVPLALLWAAWTRMAHNRSQRDKSIMADNIAAGLHEPPSLHPVIDPAVCLGCGSCVRACPEGAILGMIDGKAELIEPASCIGHGACQASKNQSQRSKPFG